ncbi:MAG: PepSY domain-containing protein [Sphingomonadales bacterium]|nr:PepSY domain-containing protein [Sphingomonadales bacterium]
MTKTDLRKLWLQVHKWLGICLAIVFVPLSFSGSMLVWHETLDAAINPQREIAGDGHASRPASAYVYAAQKHMDSGHQISSIRFEDGHAVMVTATDMKLPEESYRPLNRTNMWLDPADGRLLDKRGRSSGFVPTNGATAWRPLHPDVRSTDHWIYWAGHACFIAKRSLVVVASVRQLFQRAKMAA